MRIRTKEIRIYETQTGEQPFTAWLFGLKDTKARQIIIQRLKRLSLGNTGDCKTLIADLSELRIDFGPGYRVYFGEELSQIILLLCAGDKSSQEKDIKLAKQYWKDYRSANYV